uniref:Uncharacterized protein n=1 Tax=Glossina pallidipes TaxID=7398 RepID=A0A1A9ZIV0_GLOPL
MKLEVVGIVRVSDGIPGFALNVNNFSENACFLPPNGKQCKSLCCVFNHVLFSRQDAMTIVVVIVVLVVVRLESDLLLSSSSLPFAEVYAEEWFSFEYCIIALGCKNCLWPVGSSSQTLNGANLNVIFRQFSPAVKETSFCKQCKSSIANMFIVQDNQEEDFQSLRLL